MAGVDTQEWQGRVGKSWASEWRRTDRSFAQLTAELERRILALDFDQVLDIGCGAGELSLAIAQGRPASHVVGVDVSPDLIAVAHERGGSIPNVRFELADAAAWQPVKESAPDLLVSRHGIMFFDDPVAAFSHLRQVALPGACLLFSCFRALEFNPLFAEAGKLVSPDPGAPHPDPHAPGPFAFADQSRVAAILEQAGWRNLCFDAFDFAMVAGAGEDPVADAVGYFSRIGPAARALASLQGREHEELLVRIADLARANLHGEKVALGASAWIVAASAG